MKKPIVILLVLAVSFLILVLVFAKDKTSETKPLTQTEIKSSEGRAKFLIFTNGTRRDFSDERYHNLSGNIFISPENPTEVVFKSENVTWGDFFETLPMKLEKDCLTTGTGQVFCNDENNSLNFYLNGEIWENVLNTKISDGDRLLVSYGPKDLSPDSQIRDLEEL